MATLVHQAQWEVFPQACSCVERSGKLPLDCSWEGKTYSSENIRFSYTPASYQRKAQTQPRHGFSTACALAHRKDMSPASHFCHPEKGFIQWSQDTSRFKQQNHILGLPRGFQQRNQSNLNNAEMLVFHFIF